MSIDIPDKVIFMSDLLNLVFILAVSAVTLNYRERFISRFPSLKKFYDIVILSFFIALVGVFLDVADELEINGHYLKSITLGRIESWLFALAVGIAALGWIATLRTISRSEVRIPIVRIEETKPGHVHIDPGLYLSTSDESCNSLFVSLLYQRPGLVISRNPPEMARSTIGITDVPVIWITKVEGKNTVHPTNLPYLLHTIVTFLQKENIPKVVLLDGLEYLILENGFPAIFKFLTTLKDYALLTDSVILVPIESRAHNEQELNLLLREFEVFS